MPLTVVVEAVTHGALGRAAGGRGVVLAVEGRSPSGKTTLAGRLQEAVKGSAVVHTPMTSRGGTLATGHWAGRWPADTDSGALTDVRH